MGFLTKLLATEPKGPTDDYWYNDVGIVSTAGVVVTPETARNISTVQACVQAVSVDLAGLPLHIDERLTNGGSEHAPNHPLYDVLHDTPNSWQTSFEWREMLWGHLLLRGNSYSQIVPGPRGFADQLIPLNPARMKVEQLVNRRLRYTYTELDGTDTIYTQDEIFHIRGPSEDGIVGMSIVHLARDSFGLGMATEQFGARLFSQGAVQRGVLKHPGTLTPGAALRLKEDFNSKTTGLANAHTTVVLEEGMEWEQIGMSSEDSQFLQTRSFQVEEMARWFGVPLMRIGHTEKATSWGTGIEQFELGYVKHTLLPWGVRFEQAVTRDLILAPKRFFVKFNFDGLLRGDIKTRYAAHRIAVMAGWQDRNETRKFENMNPREGLDDLFVPQNMAIMDEDGNITPVNDAQGGAVESMDPDRNNQQASFHASLARRFAYEAAARVVRKEVERVKAIAKHNQDEDHYSDELIEFYYMHAQHVAETLHISLEQGEVYARSQRDAVLHYGSEPIERVQGAAHIAQYSDQRVAELAAIALGEETGDGTE